MSETETENKPNYDFDLILDIPLEVKAELGRSKMLVNDLLHRGATVRLHDPRALDNARAVWGDRVSYCDTMYDAAEGADAVVLVTEWHPYRQPDFKRLREAMRGVLLVDGRNIWDAAALRELGFRYQGIGHGRRH